jgi:hypothetical protein
VVGQHLVGKHVVRVLLVGQHVVRPQLGRRKLVLNRTVPRLSNLGWGAGRAGTRSVMVPTTQSASVERLIRCSVTVDHHLSHQDAGAPTAHAAPCPGSWLDGWPRRPASGLCR